MLQHPATYFTVFWVACAINGGIAFITWRQSRANGDRGFTVLLAATFLYAFGYAFTLISTDIAVLLFWARLELIGLATLPAGWVMLAVGYVKKSRVPNRRLALTLFFIPAISIILYYTNSYHHLYYGPISLSTPGPLALISATTGPWYWVFAAYTTASLLFGNLLYYWKLKKEPGKLSHQNRLMLAGSALPWLAILTYGVSSLDWLPLALTGANIVFLLIAYRPTLLTRNRVLEGIREGILVLDTENQIVDFNPAARSIIKNLTPRTVGRPAEEVLRDHPELLSQILHPDCRQAEMQLPQGRGLRCYQSRLSPLVNRRRQLIGKAVILSDVTQHTWRVDELETKARMDALTGIFNRRYLIDFGHQEIEQLRRHGKPVSVFILDIDHFKLVNDTQGHAAGDLALKSVVRTCAAALRSRDILGRWGGEEFVAILPGASPDAALLVAERVRKEIAGSLVTLDNSTTISLTASLGVTGVNMVKGDTSLEVLLQMADEALYKAKNSGRNRVVLARNKVREPAREGVR